MVHYYVEYHTHLASREHPLCDIFAIYYSIPDVPLNDIIGYIRRNRDESFDDFKKRCEEYMLTMNYGVDYKELANVPSQNGFYGGRYICDIFVEKMNSNLVKN